MASADEIFCVYHGVSTPSTTCAAKDTCGIPIITRMTFVGDHLCIGDIVFHFLFQLHDSDCNGDSNGEATIMTDPLLPVGGWL